MQPFRIWSRWRHYKSTWWTNHTYEIMAIAKHSETGEDMVVYKPLYEVPKNWWAYGYDSFVRPLSMWFEEVEYNEKTYQRFTEIKK